jgi:hypothetical protein
MKVIRMLTNDVTDIVNSIKDIESNIQKLFKEKEEIELGLIRLIKSKGFDLNIIINNFEIVQSPYGVLEDDNTYVNEHCEDSLFCPDGGSGEQYIPLENGDYLRLDYVW